MEAWVTDILKGLVGGLVTLVGLWATYRVQRKANATQEKQVEVNSYLEVGDKWKDWAEKLEGRVDDAEAKVDKLTGLFNSAVQHIKELRAFIVARGFREHLPDLPPNLEHIINPKE